jgi:hypothetical protein
VVKRYTAAGHWTRGADVVKIAMSFKFRPDVSDASAVPENSKRYQ